MKNDRHAMVDRVCERCGTPFQARKERVEVGKGRFCSLVCFNNKQYEERKYGKENCKVYIDKVSGRRKAFWRDADGTQHSTLYARVLWEQTYGEIPVGYEVHHIDGNHLNDVIENLKLLTISEHKLIEHGAERIIVDGKSMRKCPKCGKFNIDEAEYETRASYCKPCRAEYIRQYRIGTGS